MNDDLLSFAMQYPPPSFANNLRKILEKHCSFHDGPSRDKDMKQRARESPYRYKKCNNKSKSCEQSI